MTHLLSDTNLKTWINLKFETKVHLRCVLNPKFLDDELSNHENPPYGYNTIGGTDEQTSHVSWINTNILFFSFLFLSLQHHKLERSSTYTVIEWA
jgi:hypothetical protein